MKIIDLLKNEKVCISCELFPPKAGTELQNALNIVSDIAEVGPHFMSVTYGAGGTSAVSYTHLCPSGRRCLTRNQMYGNVPWVRIPPSPPDDYAVLHLFEGPFIFLQRQTSARIKNI